MNNLRIIIYCLIMLCSSCYKVNNEKTNKIVKSTLNEKLKNSLADIGFKVNVNSILKDDTLAIEIYYFLPDYYLDDESNKIIISYLINKQPEIFSDKKLVTFSIILQKFENEPLILSYLNENILEIFKKSKDNSLFIDFIEYSFINISPQELINCNELIRILPNYVDKFSFKGSIWNLLYMFSLNCKNKNALIFLEKASIEGSGINVKHLEYFKQNCNN